MSVLIDTFGCLFRNWKALGASNDLVNLYDIRDENNIY